MAKPTPASLRSRSDALHRRYAAEYAGQARATRRLEPLDDLIAKARVVFQKTRRLKGGTGREVQEVAKERLRLYLAERVAIAEARAAPPEVREVQELELRFRRVSEGYFRHFAGQSRVTRELDVLERLVAEAGRIEAGLEAIDPAAGGDARRDALEAVAGQRALMQGEATEITRAREALDPATLAGVHAERANIQMRTLQAQFEGHPLTTVRAARLREVLTTLAGIERTMDALELEGTLRESHDKNLATVAARLEAWHPVVDKIEAAWAEAPDALRVGHLGGAANAVQQTWNDHFAGQTRATRDLGLLRRMCDRTEEIARQLEALEGGGAARDKNLSAVNRALDLYSDEYRKVLAAKPQPAAAGVDPLRGMLRIGDD